MLEAFDVESAGLGVEEGEDVERGEVARRVVEEHVFRAVMHGKAVGDEGTGSRLGQVEDLLHAE